MSKRPKLIYRDAKTGKFSKAGRKNAVATGVRWRGKQYNVNPNKFEAKAFMAGDKEKPQVRYTTGGTYIPAEVARHFMRSKTYKQANEMKEEEFQEEVSESDLIADQVPFYSILKTFEDDYLDIFGFKSATIKGSDKVHQPRNLKAAKARIKAEAYKQAQKVKQANKEGKDTPDLFANIYMNAPGVYQIEFNN